MGWRESARTAASNASPGAKSSRATQTRGPLRRRAGLDRVSGHDECARRPPWQRRESACWGASRHAKPGGRTIRSGRLRQSATATISLALRAHAIVPARPDHHPASGTTPRESARVIGQRRRLCRCRCRARAGAASSTRRSPAWPRGSRLQCRASLVETRFDVPVTRGAGGSSLRDVDLMIERQQRVPGGDPVGTDDDPARRCDG